MADVADTAFLVAACRARESARPDALFSDPLAERLAGDRGREMLDKVAHLGDRAGWSSVVRTVLIDRYLVAAIERGIKTVINLGAGLDARPYRMDLPASLSWIEADQAPVIAHKEALLANERPRCRLERVAVDLGDRKRVLELLSRVSQPPALVLAEGVLPYLPPELVATLLDDLRGHEAIQFLIVDYLSAELVRFRSAMAAAQRIHEIPLPFAPEDWQGFFASHGWKVKEMGDLAKEGERCGRPFPLPEGMRAPPQQPPGAQAKPPAGMFAAYALMERA